MSASGKVVNYGFNVRLDHEFPEKRSQLIRPRLNQILGLLTLFFRYLMHYAYLWWKGRSPTMDYIYMKNGKQMYGVPIGGLGAGTIGRGFRGEFCRYQLRPGIYLHETLHANQFIVTIKNELGEIVYQKPLTCSRPQKNVLKSWDWSFKGEDGEYCGLYPRSWTVFHIPEQNITLTCRQISPVIPHNYKDSCIPAAVFVWEVNNKSQEIKFVKITFTFQNGIGEKSDKSGGCFSETFERSSSKQKVMGVLIHHAIDDMPYTFGVSANHNSNVDVTCLTEWNPLGDGKDLWDSLKNEDSFPANEICSKKTKRGEQLACAVSVRSKISPYIVRDFEFCLVWDMPQIHFGGRKKKHYKYYTKFFGRDGNVAPDIAIYSLQNYQDWENEIAKWQNPILNDEELPSWFKSAIFNETYFVSDGGSIWLDLDENEKQRLKENDPRLKYGRFAYLEGHEYRMYNTYDVHFYASFALAILWPKLQSVIQKDFSDTILQEDRSRQWYLADGSISFRKAKYSVPHDLGCPGEEPFLKINSYPIHDVSKWKDLGIKFILQCYRDYSLTKDLVQLKDMWSNMCIVMRNVSNWDKDGDGLIENGNTADQTYDTWTMSGPSSYCGILWLAALQCMCEAANVLSDDSIYREFNEILIKAKSAVEEKLWNGEYYNFDSSSRGLTIMSDQLCGLWYIKCCGLENKVYGCALKVCVYFLERHSELTAAELISFGVDSDTKIKFCCKILPEENVLKALRKIYQYNVLKYNNGTSGAVNGMKPDGKLDTYTIQSEETWTGVVYGLSALMILQGMVHEGFHTASGIYKTVYERIGLGYETPEALFENSYYRSLGYMRPLSIWSILLAWNMRKEKAEPNTET